MMWALVAVAGLAAGAISGIIGFGGTAILLPVLTLQFGPKAAVPIMAIAAIFGNLARVMAWWREVRWPAVAAYTVTAVPAAWFGARTMVSLDPKSLELGLGVFFIVLIPVRRWLAASGLKVSLLGLTVVGAAIGFLTGIVANTGPINTPFFLAHGLVRGAFIGTEAMSSLVMFISKATAFRSFGALPAAIIVSGAAAGATMMAGTYLSRRLLHKIDDNRFRWMMEAVLLAAGIAMILNALLG